MIFGRQKREDFKTRDAEVRCELSCAAGPGCELSDTGNIFPFECQTFSFSFGSGMVINKMRNAAAETGESKLEGSQIFCPSPGYLMPELGISYNPKNFLLSVLAFLARKFCVRCELVNNCSNILSLNALFRQFH